MVGQATLAFGPTLLGLAHDLGGGYGAALLLCIALQLTGAVILLAAGRPPAARPVATGWRPAVDPGAG